MTPLFPRDKVPVVVLVHTTNTMLLILQLCSRTWWHLVSTYDSPITALSEGEVPKKEAAVRGEGLVLCTGTECTQEEGLLLRLCFGCRVVVLCQPRELTRAAQCGNTQIANMYLIV